MFPSAFTTNDNLQLKCYATATTPDAKAVLIVVHGLGEHSQSLPYQQLGSFLTDKNFVQVGYDLRGHGVSAGVRGHIDSWTDLRGDLGLFVELVRVEWPNLPIFLLGASLGGLISIDFALDRPYDCAGVIALAPALSTDGASRLVRKLVPLLARTLPKVSIDPGLDLKNISRDEDAASTYTTDPLFSTRMTIRTASEIIKAVSATVENARNLKTPLLILHGEGDIIVPAVSSKNFFDRVGSTEKRRITYPEARHNLLLETNREQVFADIHDWLNGQLSH